MHLENAVYSVGLQETWGVWVLSRENTGVRKPVSLSLTYVSQANLTNTQGASVLSI